MRSHSSSLRSLSSLLIAAALLVSSNVMSAAAGEPPAATRPATATRPAASKPVKPVKPLKPVKPVEPVKPFKRLPGVRYVKQPLRIGTTWDFQYEQGVVVKFASGDGPLSRRFFGRMRAGMLFAHEPWIVAVGAVMEGSGIPSLAFGLQFEVTHLWRGLWGQVSVSMDGDAHTFTALSAGFSLLGFEWQKRLSDGGRASSAYLLKVRVPIGIIFFAR